MTSSAALDYLLDHPEALPEPARPPSPEQARKKRDQEGGK